MATTVVTIAPDGTIRFLVSESTAPLITDENAVVRRASHVEPVSVPLRYAFHGLRSMFGEKGWMAGFTRRWPCLWRINLAPTGGPILPSTYRDRAEAIAAEIEHLNAHFI